MLIVNMFFPVSCTSIILCTFCCRCCCCLHCTSSFIDSLCTWHVSTLLFSLWLQYKLYTVTVSFTKVYLLFIDLLMTEVYFILVSSLVYRDIWLWWILIMLRMLHTVHFYCFFLQLLKKKVKKLFALLCAFLRFLLKVEGIVCVFFCKCACVLL